MIYASIDLGSDLIKIVVCEYIDSKYNILASTYTRTVGIKKGIIVDSVMVQKSLMLALDEIEKQLGFRLDKAIVSIPCFDAKVNMYESEVVIPNKVTGSDIISCFEKAIKENISSKEEVLSVFPIDYVVNGDTHLLDPKGMEAYKLGCRELITTLPKELVYSYLEVFKNCKIDVIDLCISTLGDFYQFRRDEYNDLMGAIINIGNSKSEFGIFNKGMLVKNSIIPIGSNKVNHDIKYVYKIDSETARYLKENFALAKFEYAEDDFIEVSSFDSENIVITQEEISKIVESRLEEILKSVKKHLYDLTKKEISYIIITGGISNMPGFNSLLEEVFGDVINTVNVNMMGIRNNFFSSSIGMIKYLHDKLELRDINYSMYDLKNFNNAVKKHVLNDYVNDQIIEYVNNK